MPPLLGAHIREADSDRVLVAEFVPDESLQWFPVDNVWILQSGSDRRSSQVFYVGHLLSKFKVEDITTAIQTTWKLAGKDSKTELKYHQDTQLLIALANKPQLETVTEVLRELQREFPDMHQGKLLSVP